MAFAYGIFLLASETNHTGLQGVLRGVCYTFTLIHFYYQENQFILELYGVFVVSLCVFYELRTM